MFWPAFGAVVGGAIQGEQQRSVAEAAGLHALATLDENRRMQREFAQMGIQWRAEDARKAGIHPLAALGAQTHAFQPSFVGDSGGGGGSEWGFLSEMGQQAIRALSASSTQEQREMEQLQVATAHTQLEGATIDNQIKLARLREMQSVGPAFPRVNTDNFVPGQGNTAGMVIDRPLERVVSAPNRPAQEAGWRPDVSYSRTDTGLQPMIPTSLSESLESDPIGGVMWSIRNRLAPNFSGEGAPPKSMLPPGAKSWRWDYGSQEWQPSSSPGPHGAKRLQNWWPKGGYGR